jgi:hypothetical protein
MSKREKIIVSVMVVTVLLGGYLYFVARRQLSAAGADETQLDAPQRTDFVRQGHSDNSRKTPPWPVELFAIRSAERKWEKDPFLKSRWPVVGYPPARRLRNGAPASDDTQLKLDLLRLS